MTDATEQQLTALMSFGQPLLMEPVAGQAFFSSLITRIRNPASTQGASEPALTLSADMAAFGVEGYNDRYNRPYQILQGVAVLPVSGMLVHRLGAVYPRYGMTGYDGISYRLNQALNDPQVSTILLDIDSPGGMVSGAYDLADVIFQSREIKPIWSIANDVAASAGQLLAAAASHRMVTQTSITGSIGVMSMHADISRMLSDIGYDVTLMYSGEHKVDRTTYRALSEEDKSTWQTELDNLREMFAERVARFTGLRVDYVLGTEAGIFRGEEAITAGFADYIINGAEAVDFILTASDDAQPREGDDFMTTKHPNAALTQADIQAAVSAEQTRILGIMTCAESMGREDQAKVLAGVPGMTVEQAQSVLAASPQSAQFRTETALDRLMESAPGAVGPGTGGGGESSSRRIDELAACHGR